MFAKARPYIEQGREGDAMLCLESALRLNPANTAAWKEIAGLHAARRNYSKALDAYMSMFNEAGAAGMKLTGLLSTQDRRTMMLGALREGNKSLVKRLAERTGQRSGNSALPYLMMADCLASAGDLNAAVVELIDGLSVNPVFTKPLFLSEILDVKGSQSAEDAEFFSFLSETKNRLGDRRHVALFFGLKTGFVPIDLLQEWITELLESQDAPVSDRLFAAQLERRLRGESIHLDFLTIEDPKKLSPEDRYLLCRELLKTGATEKALSLITRLQAIQSNKLFQLWIESLLASNREGDALNELDHPSNPLPPHETAFEMFKLLKKTGNAESAVRLVESIEIDPESSSEQISFADFLAESGQEQLLTTFLRKTRIEKPESLNLQSAVLAKARERGDLAAALTLQNAVLNAFEPARPPAVVADRELFAQFAGQPTDLSQSEKLARTYGESVPAAIAYAFVLLKNGKTAEALVELQKHAGKIDIRSLPAHQAVAVAAILAANDLRDPAREVARVVIVENLFPSEVELLASLFHSSAQQTGTSRQSVNPP